MYVGFWPVISTNDGIRWYTTPLWSRELCMIKVIEEITNKPGWCDDVRHAHIAAKWKKEILGLDWSKYLSYADFTPSMADLVGFRDSKRFYYRDKGIS